MQTATVSAPKVKCRTIAQIESSKRPTTEPPNRLNAPPSPLTEGCRQPRRTPVAKDLPRICITKSLHLWLTWRCLMSHAACCMPQATRCNKLRIGISSATRLRPHSTSGSTSICIFIVELHNKSNSLTQISAAVAAAAGVAATAPTTCNVTQFWQTKTKRNGCRCRCRCRCCSSCFCFCLPFAVCLSRSLLHKSRLNRV